MVDETIRDTYQLMVVSADTMKRIGYSDEEIDQARKPEGFVHGNNRYKIDSPLPTTGGQGMG